MFKKNVEKFLAFFVLGLFLAFLAFNSLNIERKNFEDKLTNSRSIHLELTEEDIKNALNVLNTGIYIDRVYDHDPETKTFKADGWLWAKWKGERELSSWNPESSIDPLKTLSIYNAIEWDSYYEEDPVYYKTPDNLNYQSKGFSGRFIYGDVDYRKFPFEELVLPIELTAVDHWIDELVLLNKSELDNSKVDKKLELQGYNFEKFIVESKKRVFNSSFGLDADALASFGDEQKSIYPSIIASLHFSRSISSSAWNLFVPLITVLLVVVCSPLIDPRNHEP